MNHYFLAPHPGILQEIFRFHDDFDATITELKHASGPSEQRLISTAQQANDDFNEVFLSSLQLRPDNAPSQRRLTLLLDGGEEEEASIPEAKQPGEPEPLRTEKDHT